MSSSQLVVIAFRDEFGARQMHDALAEMQKRHLVKFDDAATVVRTQDGKVKVKQNVNLVGEGALGGAFWGMLIGILFMMPWLGLAIGVLSGALFGHVRDVGVDDDFIKRVGTTIEPGHSAIFLMIREPVPNQLIDELKGFHGEVLQTTLSAEDESKLRSAFGPE